MKRILITLSALLLISTAGYAQKNIFEKIPLKQRENVPKATRQKYGLRQLK